MIERRDKPQKGWQPMTDYVHKVKNILMEEQAAIHAIRSDLSKLESEYKGKRVTNEGYQEQRTKLKRIIDSLKFGAAQEIQKIRAEAITAFEASSIMTGDQMNDDAKIILSGVTLSPTQFTALVQRNQSNEFVSTLLREYAATHSAALEGTSLPITSAMKIEAFSIFADQAADAAKDPDGLSWAMLVDGKADPKYQ